MFILSVSKISVRLSRCQFTIQTPRQHTGECEHELTPGAGEDVDLSNGLGGLDQRDDAKKLIVLWIFVQRYCAPNREFRMLFVFFHPCALAPT